MDTHLEAVAVFKQGSAILQEALEGAVESETSFVPAPGKWNIRQIVRHLADTEIVVGMRMRQIVAEDNPTLIPFDQDAWAANLGYEKADAFIALERFRSLRDDTSWLLEHLPPSAFDRTGIHPERGTKTLLEWVQLFGRHVQTHAAQVHAIRDTWKTHAGLEI